MTVPPLFRMNLSRWSTLVVSVCSALALSGTASAHVFPTPQVIASQSIESVTLDVPNERDKPMTGFVVIAPAGVEIEQAHPAEGWTEEIDDSSARWTGGPLAALTTTKFGISLKAATEPGEVVLETELLYDGGAVVRWPVPITVTPADDTSSQNLGLAAIVGAAGLLVVLGVIILGRRSEPTAKPS